MNCVWDLVDRVCKAPRTGGVGRRAVRIHRVEDDTPQELIRRTAHGDHGNTEDDEPGYSECGDWEEASDDGGSPATPSTESALGDGERAAEDGQASSGSAGAEEGHMVVEIRYAPASFARRFLFTITSICLSMARLSHHRQPTVRFRALLNDLHRITSAGSPSIERAAAIIRTIESYIEPMYQHTLCFDESYFQKRMQMYEEGADPNLDEDQMWATTE
ncbi:hypothetical protein BHE90_010099 [Fusarium euwallaceae]|uniref:Uncharacterized protein n=1 Tax=Fusarium euwallaceae TaxID=1147111 RepID=A0A430LI75_9HYPO|nr:hypothetical protein BHE90_010099 [Fusarium euwallaceae]